MTAVDAVVAAVPAVPQGHDELIFAFLKERCNIVGLHLKALPVVVHAGRQHKIAYALSVEDGFVEAVAGDVEGRFGDHGGFEALPQDACELADVLVMRKFGVDPAGLPGGWEKGFVHVHSSALFRTFRGSGFLPEPFGGELEALYRIFVDPVSVAFEDDLFDAVFKGDGPKRVKIHIARPKLHAVAF